MLGFIEGKMERQFINSNMKYIRVVPVQNGTAWDLDQMCSQITTTFLALDMNCSVVVWIDREGRKESSKEIGDRILLELTRCGANANDVHILINDRMAENTILADESIIQAEFENPEYTYRFEGKSGKPVLKALYFEKGINYKETNHGVAMLNKIRLSRSGINSPAVARFLSTFDKECWWIG